MSARLVDSHCHLDFPDFTTDQPSVLARAAEAGVGLMLTICTHVSRFDPVHRVALAHDEVFCTAGVHPHHAADELALATEAELTRLATLPKVVGLGETGLDHYYNQSPAEQQQESFRRHLRVARATGLPVVVHTRDADADTIRLLREEGAGQGVRGVIHCFSGGMSLAEQALELGFFISFSGILTFKKSDELREVAKRVPLDRILVETDSPYLAPVPKRGKRNEPAFTRHTAELLAEVKEIPYPVLAEATTRNFLGLFDRVPAAAGARLLAA